MTERLLGRYRVEELLGTGAFATVHAAHDEQLDDPVAVKVLAHNHAANPEMRSRFVAEGQVLRRLHSPHLIRVHDLAETDDGRPFLVLELCDRGTLRQRTIAARADGWTPTDADAVAVAVPLAAAIRAMDQAGIVHRDLTPANALLTTAPPPVDGTAPSSAIIEAGERLVVTDLGFCKDLAASTGITASGGTEGFRPPEQQTPGGTVDVRADLWAASAVLVWVLTGQAGLAPTDAVHAMVNAGITRDLAAAIAHALAEDPDRRPSTPQAWLAGITANAVLPSSPHPTPGPATTASAGPSPQRLSRTGLWGVAVGVVLLALAATRLGGGSGLADGDTGEVPDHLAGQDLSGLSLADLDDMAAASEMPSSTLSDPTPTPTPTPTGPPPGFEDRHGGQWAMHLVTLEGWEYDVVVEVDFAYQLGKSVESSAPGRARFTSAVHGGSTATYTPTLPGRTAPEQSASVVAAFGQVDTTETVGADPCLTGTDLVGGTERVHVFYCVLDYLAGGHTRHSWLEDDEADIDAVLEQLADRPPAHYEAKLDYGCTVFLYPDGTITLDPDLPRELCTISGDAVRDTPPSTDDAR